MVHKKLREILILNDYNIPGNVKGQELYPKGILLRSSTSGIYRFSLEKHINGGLHPIQKPFTQLVKKMVVKKTLVIFSFLACIHSDNKAIQYAGYLSYWRYVYSELRRIDPDYYRKK